MSRNAADKPIQPVANPSDTVENQMQRTPAAAPVKVLRRFLQKFPETEEYSSQLHLAQLVNHSESLVRAIEGGRMKMSRKFAQALSTATGVSKDWLMLPQVDTEDVPSENGRLLKMEDALARIQGYAARGYRAKPRCPAVDQAAATGSGIPVVLDPDYAAFVVKARIAARDCGYALAIHGSMTRDLDLIAIPWVKDCRSPTALIAQVAYRTDCETDGHRVHEREHGRLAVAFMLRTHFSDARYVDFSIMPPASQNAETAHR